MKASWRNVLRDSTVTVTSAATGYDAYRLYDEFFGKQWKAGSTATQTIHVDRGAGVLDAVDTLIIPGGHLLSGCGLTFERSANNTDWSAIVTNWTQSGSSIIVKQGSGTNTDRYLRVVISGASVAPQAGEIWIGLLYSFASGLSSGTEIGLEVPRVINESMFSKTAHTVNLGTSKIRINAQIKSISVAERATFEDWFEVGAIYPFYFVDQNGDGYFARFYEQPRIVERDAGISYASPIIQQVF